MLRHRYHRKESNQQFQDLGFRRNLVVPGAPASCHGTATVSSLNLSLILVATLRRGAVGWLGMFPSSLSATILKHVSTLVHFAPDISYVYDTTILIIFISALRSFQILRFFVVRLSYVFFVCSALAAFCAFVLCISILCPGGLIYAFINWPIALISSCRFRLVRCRGPWGESVRSVVLLRNQGRRDEAVRFRRRRNLEIFM